MQHPQVNVHRRTCLGSPRPAYDAAAGADADKASAIPTDGLLLRHGVEQRSDSRHVHFQDGIVGHHSWVADRLTDFDQLVKDWQSGGGDQIRQELLAAMSTTT